MPVSRKASKADTTSGAESVELSDITWGEARGRAASLGEQAEEPQNRLLNILILSFEFHVGLRCLFWTSGKEALAIDDPFGQ